jgi:hypothetical protein
VYGAGYRTEQEAVDWMDGVVERPPTARTADHDRRWHERKRGDDCSHDRNV